MKHRSPLAVFFLSLLTLGIYALVWQVKTKGELKKLGADIPTAWLIIVPFANLWWIWKYCAGVEKISGGKISAVLALILMLLLSIVGYAILQSLFNDLKVGVPNQTAPATPGQASYPSPTAGPMAPSGPGAMPEPITNPLPPSPSDPTEPPQPPLPPATPPA